MIFSRAFHLGGSRVIKLAKLYLKQVINTLIYEKLYTVLVQIKAVLNSLNS